MINSDIYTRCKRAILSCRTVHQLAFANKYIELAHFRGLLSNAEGGVLAAVSRAVKFRISNKKWVLSHTES